jgi:hypothetical protein
MGRFAGQAAQVIVELNGCGRGGKLFIASGICSHFFLLKVPIKSILYPKTNERWIGSLRASATAKHDEDDGGANNRRRRGRRRALKTPRDICEHTCSRELRVARALRVALWVGSDCSTADIKN